jgi:hypothetical protein
MGSTTEVAADLKVNDLTAATFNKIKHGFASIDNSVSHAASGMASFVKQTASTALGVQIAGLPHMLHAVYESAVESAMAMGKEEKSVAAALMMTDRQGKTYAELRGEAKGLRSELREMGMAAGISGESMVESFTDIAARTDKGTDAVMDMMKQMAQAGRIVPGGLSGITQGFEQIEMGIARARNPVVQMISSTGLLKGNARQVAKEMQKMAPDKMMELAERAITKMAKKMENVPLSFSEAVTSMKDMREELFELVGAPIFKGFAPIMNTIRNEFKSHRDDIAKWAEAVGAQAGNAVEYAGARVKDVFAAIRDNWDGIAHSISATADALKGAGSFLIEHKDVLGRMAMMGTAPIAGLASDDPGHSSVGGILGDVAGGAMAGGKMGGPVGAIIGAAGAAIGAATEEMAALTKSMLYAIPAIGENLVWTEATTNALKRENTERQTEIEKMKNHAEANDRFIKGAEEMIQLQNRPAMSKGSIGPTLDMPGTGFADMTEGVAMKVDESTKLLGDKMTNSFNEMLDAAIASNDAGQMSAVQNVLGSSTQLQYALATSGVKVSAGFNDLIDAMIEGGKMTAEAGKRAKELVSKKGAGGLASMGGVHVGGGNTVNMKMEFKEADPDRIMLRFKSDFTRAAASRTAARVSGPFGGF